MNRHNIIKDLNTIDFMKNVDKYKITDVLRENPNFNINDEVFKKETFETCFADETLLLALIEYEYGLEYYLKKSKNFTAIELAEISGLKVLSTVDIQDVGLFIQGIGNNKNPYYVIIDNVAHFLNNKTLRSMALRVLRERLKDSDIITPRTVLEMIR